MTNYEAVSKCKTELDTIESRLKGLRDNVGMNTKENINNALRCITAMYQALNDTDNSLQANDEGRFEL